MLEPGFSDALAASGFKHRASFQADGSVVYRLADGSGHVRVDRAKWDALGKEFEADMAPVKRLTILLSIGLMPGIFIFGMTLAQILPFGGAMILAGIFLGPLAIYFHHSFAVKKSAGRMEAKLAAERPCAAVARDPRRTPHWLDIALLVLVGPHLALAVIGEIGGPDTFRGTPWWGTGIGPMEITAALLIGLRLAWPRIGPWLARAS
jgi:hypothetical protein